jgi:biopolymer transport protein ExbB
MLFLNLLLLQKVELVNEDATALAKQSVLDVILSSGPVGVTIIAILIVLSFVAATIFFERVFTIRRFDHTDPNFMHNIKYHVQSGNLQAAHALCQTTDSPTARVIEKGLSRIGQPMLDIERSMETAGKVEVYHLEKKLGYLSLIAKLAPMFGFVGTIMGVIKIFYDISLTDNLSIGNISGGLYQKMITSASGLMVGIIAFLGYYILTMMIDRVINRIERASMELIDLLHEPGK